MYEREWIRQELHRHEGYRPYPYQDAVGKTTIGWGHNLTDNGIPERMSIELRELDIDKACAELDEIWRGWRGLDPVRAGVLLNMCFNMGGPTLKKFSKMWSAVKAGNWAEAGKQMANSVWAQQVGPRAVELRLQMETGRA